MGAGLVPTVAKGASLRFRNNVVCCISRVAGPVVATRAGSVRCRRCRCGERQRGRQRDGRSDSDNQLLHEPVHSVVGGRCRTLRLALLGVNGAGEPLAEIDKATDRSWAIRWRCHLTRSVWGNNPDGTQPGTHGVRRFAVEIGDVGPPTRTPPPARPPDFGQGGSAVSPALGSPHTRPGSGISVQSPKCSETCGAEPAFRGGWTRSWVRRGDPATVRSRLLDHRARATSESRAARRPVRSVA